MKKYDLSRPVGKGGKHRGRDEISRTILLPEKHNQMVISLMAGRGLINVSDFFRRLLEEEAARQDSRAPIFAALDRIKVRRKVTATDVQAILTALEWDTESA